MNILYIGPYRQLDMSGTHSFAILQKLLKIPDINVSSRPIYIQNNTTDSINKNISKREVFNAEHQKLDHYDTIIQNVPIKWFCSDLRFKNNIFIPILDSENFFDEDIQKLEYCNKILVDSDYSQLRFNAIGLKDKVHRYVLSTEPDIITDLFGPTVDKKMDLKIYNSFIKIYTIVNYTKDTDIIHDTIISFLSTEKRSNCCFVLFLLNFNQDESTRLSEFLSLVYQSLNRTMIFRKVLLVPIDASSENLLAAHKTGDIFLNIGAASYNSLNEMLCSSANSQFVSSKNSDFTRPNIQNNRLSSVGYSITEHENFFSTSDFPATLTNSVFSSSKLETLICQ